jgi:nucleoside-diphosphate-sugar epimerase
MKYLVTGGAGFIGSNLVNELIKDGHEVVVLDNLKTGDRDNINKEAHFVCFDLSNKSWPALITSVLGGVDTIFHLAALARVQPSIDHPQEFHEANVNGTLNLLIAAHDAGVRRVVYSASSSAYGETEVLPTSETEPTNPLSPYGLQKLIGEQYCTVFSKVYELETVSLRYFNIYGEGMSSEGGYPLAMAKFFKQIQDGNPMTIWGDGEQRRDFTYVQDVVQANILAAHSKNVGNGEVINIGNGDNRSVNEIAKLIGDETTHLDAVLEPRNTLADNSKAKELLGWEPTMTVEKWIPKYKKEIGL